MKRLFLIGILMAVTFHVSAKYDEWTITTNERDRYHGAVVGNGYFGIISNPSLLKSGNVVLSGVFDVAKEYDISQNALGPVFTDMEMTIDGQPVKDEALKDWSQTLDMQHARFISTATVAGKAKICRSIMALRHLPNVALAVVEVEPLKDIEMTVQNKYGLPGEMNDFQTSFKASYDKYALYVYQLSGKTLTGMHRVSAASMFMFDGNEPEITPAQDLKDGISFTVSLKKGQRYRFALTGAVCSSADTHDPISESKRLAIFVYKTSIDEQIKRHEQEWAKLWKGDIIIEGDEAAQQFARHGLYQLYSVARAGQPIGISPMALTSPFGYYGHYFWDTELWMYPVYLTFQPAIARSLMDFRCNTLEPAKKNAVIHGYKGAMYPWEADVTGYECTPIWALTGTYEHHITADIGIALWNYYQMTGDKQWLREKAWSVLKEIAAFWVDRVTKNADGSYSILNVVCADEYAENVDDNAFTNAAVACVMRGITKAATILGERVDPVWNEIADKLVFIKDKDGVVAEYRGYDGRQIKQADVNLLAHPLGVQTDPKEMRANADYYEPRIAPGGPAMSQSVLVVIHARLGDPDRALEIFRGVCQRHLRAPFSTFSESAHTNSTSFLTGVGGMLQSIVYGFGGLEITADGIVQHPSKLPRGWKSLTITGVGPNQQTFTVNNN